MESGAPSAAQDQHRVLVVDDYQDLADSLTLMLRALGADARAVYDGESALRSVVEFRPHLILLDLGLPGLTGLDVARALSQIPDAAGTRVVALSGWSHDEALRQSLEAGFDDFIVKPVAIETLQQLLAKT
jgi:two-component system CheB/CheR fusion protein